MIYELRIYRCLPGRLPALIKRFEDATLRIWDKHGIEQAGFWTTVIGKINNDLTYLIRWASMADREARWKAFTTSRVAGRARCLRGRRADRCQHHQPVPRADQVLAAHLGQGTNPALEVARQKPPIYPQ